MHLLCWTTLRNLYTRSRISLLDSLKFEIIDTAKKEDLWEEPVTYDSDRYTMLPLLTTRRIIKYIHSNIGFNTGILNGKL